MRERAWPSLDDLLSGSAELARLPQAAAERLMSELIYRPWFDRTAAGLLTDWFFPLSRLWAAGLESEGMLQRFAQRTGVDRPASLLGPALARLQHYQARYLAAESGWRAALFDGAGDPGELPQIEKRRRRAAVKLMAGRSYFLPARLATRYDKVRWDMVPPDAVAARHEDRLQRLDDAYALPGTPPAVARSRRIAVEGFDQFWLRFASPAEGAGTAWARVLEPAGRQPVATLVFLHGIGVEMEFWTETRDAFAALLERGFRLLLPEAPGHGRRRRAGFYGGEPILARGPCGILDHMQAAVPEAGLYLQWCRDLGGPVALGGISLGSLTSQLVGWACADWPARARPDALFLVAPGGDFPRITFESDLATGLGVPQQLQRAGWSHERVRHWRPLVDTGRRPALPAGRVVAALGSADMITHYDDARRMLRDWGVPDGNILVAEKGHFSVSLDTHWLRQAIDRLAQLLR